LVSLARATVLTQVRNDPLGELIEWGGGFVIGTDQVESGCGRIIVGFYSKQAPLVGSQIITMHRRVNTRRIRGRVIGNEREPAG